MTSNVYTKNVESARKAAREVLRTRAISNLMTNRRTHTEEIEALEKRTVSLDKQLAIAAYDVEQAKATNNPRLEDLQKTFGNVEKEVTREKKDIKCSVERHQDLIADINREIDEYGDGKKKVSFEALEELALEFVKAGVKQSFIDGDFSVQDSQ